MDEQLLHEFDDWELRSTDDKGKRPVVEEEEDEEHQQQLSGGDEGGDASGEAGAQGAAAPNSPRGSEPGDLTCAICLGCIPLENMAMVKGCDHMYCATCILHWALHKEEAWCPQCKQPFSYLLTYRTLDGDLHDFPSEESVCLLKRARWFQDHLRFVDHSAAAMVDDVRAADHIAWQEYEEYEDDEELESFYFSSAAGRARIVLGNRRYGEGGFISGGRRQARPVVERKRSNKMGKSGEHAVVSAPPVPPSSAIRTPNANGGRKTRPGSGGGASSSVPLSTSAGRESIYSSSPGASGSALYGTSPSGSGRRARRNARRAALDAGLEAAAGSWGSRA